MNSIQLTRPLATAAVLTVAGFVVAAPALAAPGTHPTKAQIEHAEAVAAAGSHSTKAQIEHEEETGAPRTYESSIVAEAVGQAQGTAPRTYESDIVAHAVRQAQGTPRQAPQAPSRHPDPAQPTSTLLVVLGGTALVGAVGFTAYRFQHHGGVGPTTA